MPSSLSSAFLAHIIQRVFLIGQSPAFTDHCRVDVLIIGETDRDCASVLIDISGFTANGLTGKELD
jgi:hypothetical protein